jgi:hypothetical protein
MAYAVSHTAFARVAANRTGDIMPSAEVRVVGVVVLAPVGGEHAVPSR